MTIGIDLGTAVLPRGLVQALGLVLEQNHALVFFLYGGNMNTEEIIEQIDAEIAKLQQAKGLLLGTDSPIKKSQAVRRRKLQFRESLQ
jgi:hypothetical protein